MLSRFACTTKSSSRWYSMAAPMSQSILSQAGVTDPHHNLELFPGREETHSSTLSNGVRVVSMEWPGNVATVGVQIEAGAREVDNPLHAGLSDFLSKLLYRGTKNRTAIQVTRDCEKFAFHGLSFSNRNIVGVPCDVLKDYVPQAMSHLSDLVLNPDLESYVVKEYTPVYKLALKDVPEETRLHDLAHAAAYGGQSLGFSTYPTDESLNYFATTDAVAKFHHDYYTPERMLVTMVGVSHDQAVDLAEKYFGYLPSGQGKPLSSSPMQYDGGDMHISETVNAQQAHVFVGYDWKPCSDEDYVCLNVLSILLGGGASFSTGGPGKGLHSRLYIDGLCRHQWIDQASVLLAPYKDTTLFGLHGVSAPTETQRLTLVLCEQLKRLGSFQEEEVTRAKNGLIYQIMAAWETRSAAFEDMGLSYSIFGKRDGLEKHLKDIKAVTSAKLSKVAKEIIARGKKPAVASLNAASGAVVTSDMVAAWMSK